MSRILNFKNESGGGQNDDRDPNREQGRDRQGADAGEFDSGPAEPPQLDMQALVAERDRLAEENARLREQVLRARADFDNLRKRIERERHDMQQQAAMELVRALLPVLDGLERAIAAEPDVDDVFHKGVRLIAREFMDTLKRFGLQPIEAVGKKFDPNLHEAVDRQETNEHEDQTVMDQWQRGYMFKGRLLRPAMVKVAVPEPESK